jgi:molecular chaperone GrpE
METPETQVDSTVDDSRTEEVHAAPPNAASTVVAERDALAADKAELQDLLLRRQAEFDNFRRRSERERADILEYASMDTVKALLPVLDDFERALKMSAPADAAGGEVRKGMELIYTRLLDALKKIGLEPITAIGKPFDPHHHEAIDRAASDEVPEDTILDEFQRGYFFRGKLMRPAMVKVAVKS